VHELGIFAIYNGKYWQYDYSGNQILKLSKDVIQSYYLEAAGELDSNKARAIGDYAKQSLSTARRQAMITLLKAEPGIEISVNELDTDLYYLNCKNGTIDLRTGAIKPHDKGDMISKYIDTDYKLEAQSGQWLNFITDIFQNKEDLILYNHLCLGMSATADTTSQAVFMPYGTGWNGKSTMLNTVRDVLGADYAAEISPAAFMDNDKSKGPNEAIASLYKKRFVCATETVTRHKLAVDLVKRATGGEKLWHDKKYQHGFEFTPTFHLWLSSNTRSTVDDQTDSIWLRIKQIPFKSEYRPEDSNFNRNLKDELTTPKNREGILAWLVEGACQWFKDGKDIKDPLDVVRATLEYRNEQDNIREYLEQCTAKDEASEVVFQQVWKNYSDWCKANDIYRIHRTNFKEQLKIHGYHIFNGNSNQVFIKGLRIGIC
jgi:putative DNA primase/helicase